MPDIIPLLGYRYHRHIGLVQKNYYTVRKTAGK